MAFAAAAYTAIQYAYTAKTMTEAVNSGNETAIAMSAVQMLVPASSGMGFEAAVMEVAEDATVGAVSEAVKTVAIEDISDSLMAQAFASAKDGSVTVFHITNTLGSAGRLLAIGGEGQLSQILTGTEMVSGKLASNSDVAKVTKAATTVWGQHAGTAITAMQMASLALSLGGEGQLSQVLGGVASIGARATDGKPAASSHASIKGLTAEGAQLPSSVVEVHQRLGDAFSQSQILYNSQEGVEWTPLAALQFSLSPLSSLFTDDGGKLNILSATPDSSVVQRVDAQDMTHTYFISQVPGEPLGNIYSTEIISGVNAVTGRPVLDYVTTGGAPALHHALSGPTFDSQFLPFGNEEQDMNNQIEEAKAFQVTSASYHLTSKGGVGANFKVRVENYLASLGDDIIPEVRGLEVMVCSNDFVIFRNDTTGRVFVSIRGTEFALTKNALRDFGNDLPFPKGSLLNGFDMSASSRFADVERAVEKFFKDNPTISPKDVTFVGHSLGGAQAVAFGLKYPESKAIAFNPYGLPPSADFHPSSTGSNISVLHIKGDWLSSFFAAAVKSGRGVTETRQLSKGNVFPHSLTNFTPSQKVLDAARRGNE